MPCIGQINEISPDKALVAALLRGWLRVRQAGGMPLFHSLPERPTGIATRTVAGGGKGLAAADDNSGVNAQRNVDSLPRRGKRTERGVSTPGAPNKPGPAL
jgi:hypothetical protein